MALIVEGADGVAVDVLLVQGSWAGHGVGSFLSVQKQRTDRVIDRRNGIKSASVMP